MKILLWRKSCGWDALKTCLPSLPFPVLGLPDFVVIAWPLHNRPEIPSHEVWKPDRPNAIYISSATGASFGCPFQSRLYSEHRGTRKPIIERPFRHRLFFTSTQDQFHTRVRRFTRRCGWGLRSSEARRHVTGETLQPLDTRRWRNYNNSKYQEPVTQWNGVVYQKSVTSLKNGTLLVQYSSNYQKNSST